LAGVAEGRRRRGIDEGRRHQQQAHAHLLDLAAQAPDGQAVAQLVDGLDGRVEKPGHQQEARRAHPGADLQGQLGEIHRRRAQAHQDQQHPEGQHRPREHEA